MELVKQQWLRHQFFSDPDKVIKLKKGDVLLEENAFNRRLYHINYGVIKGLLCDSNEPEEEVFQSSQNTFVGVLSFFSDSNLSYAKLVAMEESEVSYVESKEEVIEKGGYQVFFEYFVPIIVNELLIRQMYAHNMANEKKMALQKLMETSNLATLGQLAAGLAHELNNAIGVIQRKTEWFAENISKYLQEQNHDGMYSFYLKGVERGHTISTSEIRGLRKNLEKTFHIDSSVSQKFARAGLGIDELIPFKKNLSAMADRISYFYDMGAALHDMTISSRHVESVVKSVKQLGTSNYSMEQEVNLNNTLNESISILKRILTNIELELDLQYFPNIQASHSGLVQVWVNIIKNAAESMLSQPQITARLMISSKLVRNKIKVEICDNGPGISPEILPEIFRPNFTTKVGGLSFGLGLGLSIVQKIIHSHNGEIEVASKPGCTTFRITLPFKPYPISDDK
ncbi:MAG: hypothetical protein JJU28_01435 [Cyclobacteriaceae bacterium]|nr:hypothetical protein [Cyclobacteriaceae bacterium]